MLKILLSFLILLPMSRQACAQTGAKTGYDTIHNAAKAKIYDAVLAGIEGVTDSEGAVSCSDSALHSWSYFFYSPSTSRWVQVKACNGKIFSAAPFSPVENDTLTETPVPPSFPDSTSAVELFKYADLISPPPQRGGENYVKMTLGLFPAQKGRPKNIYWQIDYPEGTAYVSMDGQAYATAKKQERPPEAKKQARQNLPAPESAKHNLEAARAAAEREQGGARLAGVTGRGDAAGKFACTQKDGWLYHFRSNGKKNIVSVRACDGQTVITGNNDGITKKSDFLPAVFIDTGKVMDILRKNHACDKRIKDTTQPFRLEMKEIASAKQTRNAAVWTVKCSGETFMVDAQSGKYLGKDIDE